MDNKLVSIIAPAYNHEKFIINCLESVANQTYPYKELIIIDDLSTDNTVWQIKQTISRKDIQDNFCGGIHFIGHKQNLGAHFSINEGLHLARGHYLSIINTDDLYELGRLQIMIDKMEQAGVQFAFSKLDLIDEKGIIQNNKECQEYQRLHLLQEAVENYPNFILILLEGNAASTSGNMIFTKELYNQVGDFRKYRYMHDWDFILRVVLCQEPLFVDETTYLYRIHETNTIKEKETKSDQYHEEVVRILSDIFKKIQDGMYKNPKIPSIEVLEYFIYQIVRHRFFASIWNNAKTGGTK